MYDNSTESSPQKGQAPQLQPVLHSKRSGPKATLEVLVPNSPQALARTPQWAKPIVMAASNSQQARGQSKIARPSHLEVFVVTTNQQGLMAPEPSMALASSVMDAANSGELKPSMSAGRNKTQTEHLRRLCSPLG